MRLELTGRHLDITPALRRLVVNKLSKLERLLNDSAVSAQVVLVRERRSCKAEITLHARGEKFLHSVGDSAAWETSMSEVVDKLAHQASKIKGKYQERKRRGRKSPPPALPPVAATSPVAVAVMPSSRVRPRMPPVMRASRQAIKAMSLADAAREVDRNGDGIVVFRDRETASISVLFRRDGELTLVETKPQGQ